LDDHVYKIIELSGSSQKSNRGRNPDRRVPCRAIAKELALVRGGADTGPIEGGKVQHYQVALKIGFIVNDVRAV